MIRIKDLTPADRGRWVEYTDGIGKKQKGKLKGWNPSHIFVVYKCNNEWDRYADFTGAATDPRDLTFTK